MKYSVHFCVPVFDFLEPDESVSRRERVHAFFRPAAWREPFFLFEGLL
jgi:hypothetical protein